MNRSQRLALNDNNGNGRDGSSENGSKRKLSEIPPDELTPEQEAELERRREHMRQMHAEGKMGAEYGKLGGRPRKKRVSEEVASREFAESVANRLQEMIEDGSDVPPSVQLQAIRVITELEAKEESYRRNEEDRELNQDIKDILAKYLARAQAAGILDGVPGLPQLPGRAGEVVESSARRVQ